MKYFYAKLHAPRSTFGQDMTAAEAKLMQEHVVYLNGLAQKGWAVVFGPVADPKGFFGVVIFELPDEVEVNALVAGDPTIRAGMGFRYEVHPMPRAAMRR